MNVWTGQDAPPPLEDAARLTNFEFVVPDAEELEKIKSRLENPFGTKFRVVIC